MHRFLVPSVAHPLRLLRAGSLTFFALWFGLLWPIRVGASIVERELRQAQGLGCHSAPALIEARDARDPGASDAAPVVDAAPPPCHRVAGSDAAVAPDFHKDGAGSPAQRGDALAQDSDVAGHAAACRCASGPSIGRRPCGCGHSLGSLPAPPDPALRLSLLAFGRRLDVLIDVRSAPKPATAEPSVPVPPPSTSTVS